MISQKRKIKFGLMASGNGSNVQAIIDYQRLHNTNYQVQVVIIDQANAFVIKRCEKLKIPYELIEKKDLSQSAYEEKLIKLLQKFQVDWVVLAGFMKVLGPIFLQAFQESKDIYNYYKIINIHPSLLPAYSGLNSYDRAFKDMQTFGGITIHLIDEGIDTGPILLQEKFIRRKDDTLQDFKKRGLDLEHLYYPKILASLSIDPENFIRSKLGKDL